MLSLQMLKCSPVFMIQKHATASSVFDILSLMQKRESVCSLEMNSMNDLCSHGTVFSSMVGSALTTRTVQKHLTKCTRSTESGFSSQPSNSSIADRHSGSWRFTMMPMVVQRVEKRLSVDHAELVSRVVIECIDISHSLFI